mmetsp:Transcript_3062/g.3572  ORF Transcript_3062/g.3572 Transcript_3062/m.3572 type:complete len:94 (-) Transcript_3062:2-283(-)
MLGWRCSLAAAERAPLPGMARAEMATGPWLVHLMPGEDDRRRQDFVECDFTNMTDGKTLHFGIVYRDEVAKKEAQNAESAEAHAMSGSRCSPA